MRFLLDEGIPVQLLGPLRLNASHEFEHVDGVKWKGKHDAFLFDDAAGRDFAAIVTLDLDQLSDPELCRALRRSGLHHDIVEDLDAAGGQRIVEVALLSAGARHETFDPQRERQRYPYWH